MKCDYGAEILKSNQNDHVRKKTEESSEDTE